MSSNKYSISEREMMRRNKEVIRRVEQAIVQYKESEAMSKLDIEAKQLSKKLEGVTVDDAKIYLYAKYQQRKKKEKFIEIYDVVHDIVLKIWDKLQKLQPFGERYIQTFMGQYGNYENIEQNKIAKTENRTENNKKEINTQNKERDVLINWAENIMARWGMK